MMGGNPAEISVHRISCFTEGVGSMEPKILAAEVNKVGESHH